MDRRAFNPKPPLGPIKSSEVAKNRSQNDHTREGGESTSHGKKNMTFRAILVSYITFRYINKYLYLTDSYHDKHKVPVFVITRLTVIDR